MFNQQFKSFIGHIRQAMKLQDKRKSITSETKMKKSKTITTLMLKKLKARSSPPKKPMKMKIWKRETIINLPPQLWMRDPVVTHS